VSVASKPREAAPSTEEDHVVDAGPDEIQMAERKGAATSWAIVPTTVAPAIQFTIQVSWN